MCQKLDMLFNTMMELGIKATCFICKPFFQFFHEDTIEAYTDLAYSIIKESTEPDEQQLKLFDVFEFYVDEDDDLMEMLDEDASDVEELLVMAS